MGLHLCPIEPDDWANGPDDVVGVECRLCEGMGVIVGDDDADRTCPRCDGAGVIDTPEPEEPSMSDFDE